MNTKSYSKGLLIAFLLLFITLCTSFKMKAEWNGVVIAESDDIVNVEGNPYFPASSLKSEFIEESPTTTVCSWKGTANYWSLNVNGKVNKDAVWFYSNPKPAATQVKGRIAFWKGVKVY